MEKRNLCCRPNIIATWENALMMMMIGSLEMMDYCAYEWSKMELIEVWSDHQMSLDNI